jgi:poly(A) polymerase Pap1
MFDNVLIVLVDSKRIEGIITGFTDINFHENLNKTNTTMYHQIEILQNDGKTITIDVTKDNYISGISKATGVSTKTFKARLCQYKGDTSSNCVLSGGRKSKNAKKHRKRRTVRHRQHKRKQ